MDVSDRARYLLLGDWGRVVRDPIDLLRVTFVVGAVVLLVLDNSQALRMVATAVLVVFARFVDLPRPFDLGLVVGMGLQAWGKALGLYQGIEWYDVVVHSGLPLLVSPLGYIALARLQVVPDLPRAGREASLRGRLPGDLLRDGGLRGSPVGGL